MRSLLPAPARVHQFVELSMKARLGDIPKAELEELLRSGAAVCPRCSRTLELTGYRRTETPYMVEEVLSCEGCASDLLLRREERA